MAILINKYIDSKYDVMDVPTLDIHVDYLQKTKRDDKLLKRSCTMVSVTASHPVGLGSNPGQGRQTN